MATTTSARTGQKREASTSIEALMERLQVLEDERAIRETLHRYSHTIDYGPPEAWAQVFTEDGVFDVFGIDGRTHHKENGRAELAHYLSTKKLPPEQYDKHLIFSPMVQVKGNTAKVESYFVALRDVPEGGPRIFVYGRYRDTLVKVNGQWLIKERLAESETVGGVSASLVKLAYNLPPKRRPQA